MPDNLPKAPPELTSTAWAAYGNTADDEDFLVGSPEGLRVLRDHIDQAIKQGVSHIETPGIEFNGVKCKESPTATPNHRWDFLAPYGCVVFLVVVLALAAYGLVTLLH